MTTINLAESQNLPFACLPRLYFLLFAIVALHLSRVLYKSTLFMQNKPNLPAPQMNISSVLTKDYENKTRLPAPGKQTQSNPIHPPPFLPTYRSQLSQLVCRPNRIIFTVIRPQKPKMNIELVRLPPLILDRLGPDYITRDELSLWGYDLPEMSIKPGSRALYVRI